MDPPNFCPPSNKRPTGDPRTHGSDDLQGINCREPQGLERGIYRFHPGVNSKRIDLISVMLETRVRLPKCENAYESQSASIQDNDGISGSVYLEVSRFQARKRTKVWTYEQCLLGQHKMAQPLSGVSGVRPKEIQHRLWPIPNTIGARWAEDPNERQSSPGSRS